MSELPPGWVWSTLGEVSEKPQYGWTTKANHNGTSVRLLRTTDITSGSIDWSHVPACTEEPADLKKYLLASDDIVVSRAGSVGASIRVTAPPPAVFASYLIRLRAVGIEPAYMSWFLRSALYWNQIRGAAAGIALLNVNAKKLAAISMPLAPLNEQWRIVAAIEEQLSRLDAADASLAAASKRARLLSDTVSQGIGSAEEEVALGELLREPLRNGHSAKASRDGVIRTLTLSAVTRSDFSDANTKLTSADPNKVRALWLEPGDIFIERSNTPELVGTAALYRGRTDWAIFPDLLIRVRVGDRILPEYLEIVLKSSAARTYFRRAAQGIAGSMPKIDQRTIERLPVPLPSLRGQRRIVAEVEERLSVIDAMRASIERAQRRSAALRRWTLERAFRGELVPQDPSDVPASALLERIRAGRG